jgi:hypothetical protein
MPDAEDSGRKRRRVPLTLITTGLSLAIAVSSLALSKQADDRSAATERELRQVNVEVVGATLPVLGQLVIKPEIRAAVSAAISNASLRGVIVRDARLQLDGKQVGCAVGWIDQADLPRLDMGAPSPPRVEQELPMALEARAVRNVAFLFVLKDPGLYPQCVDSRLFRRLARKDLGRLVTQEGQQRLHLLLDLVPRQRIDVPIDVVFCVPRFRGRQRFAPGDGINARPGESACA